MGALSDPTRISEPISATCPHFQRDTDKRFVQREEGRHDVEPDTFPALSIKPAGLCTATDVLNVGKGWRRYSEQQGEGKINDATQHDA